MGAIAFFRRYFFILLLCFAISFAIKSKAHSQTAPAGKEEPKREFSMKVSVEEVRIDAVVLDGNGNQVADLTADDFELFQDGKAQKLVSCTYVNEYGKAPAKEPSREIRSIPSAEAFRRIIVFVVDDIKLCFEHHSNTRMGLQKFVENQMQPNDLIAIIRTDAGIGALSQFTSDKQKLLSTIKSMPAPPVPCAEKNKSDSFDYAQRLSDISMKGAVERTMSSGSSGGSLPAFKPIEDMFIKNKKPLGILKEVFDAQTLAIDYSIKALQDMPGRKSLVFMTDNIAGVGPEFLYDELADQALRAGVVIDTLDMTGLEMDSGLPAFSRYLPLSKKTGGILVENSNFFTHGIRPVNESSKGYYLLSYIPPANTFNKDNRNVYHRVRVKVKRRGIEVHSRDGFLGDPISPKPVLRATTLQQAILSPFKYNDFELRVSSGYAYAPKPGYFLRSWLHLDGKDLTFAAEENGAHSLSLEMLTMTADARSMIQDSKMLHYRFQLSDADVYRIRRDGIDLNTYLPVKNPGKYYVRAAVRDIASGKIGSGYQFLNIQDLKNRRHALSSLFVLNHGEDASAIKSGDIAIDKDASDFARKWESSRKSPVRRSFLKGEGFDYMSILYNAQSEAAPLELQSVVYRDGKEVYRRNPEEIDPKEADDLGRILIMKRLDFTADMEEGTYQLQLRVANRQSKEKSAAIQTIDFEIRK
jgi:VWFA-related protein